MILSISSMTLCPLELFFFFFNDTATTEIYTLSLHDALPIYAARTSRGSADCLRPRARPSSDLVVLAPRAIAPWRGSRSEEHTSELQSLAYLVCRLLLEKKKNKVDCLYIDEHDD